MLAGWPCESKGRIPTPSEGAPFQDWLRMSGDREIEAEVWAARASTDAPTELERQCQSWLGPGEWERALRFRHASARNQHVVGRGMARKLLTLRTATSPSRVVLNWSNHGKPFVVAPREVTRPFNVSHTEGLVLVGLCDRGPIGVDVERLSRSPDLGLARRYFAPPEVDYVWNQGDEERRHLAFLRVWTLKESFIKAIGTGLTMPLADFTFEQIDTPTPQVRMLHNDSSLAGGWQFLSFSPAPGYIAAVAVRATPRDSAITPHPHPADPEPRLKLRLQRFEELLPPTHADSPGEP